MGFFGLSGEGKKAKGQMDLINATNWDKAKADWGKSNDLWGKASSLRPEVEQGYRNFRDEGFGDQGLDELVNSRNARMKDIMSAYNGVDPANTVADRMDAKTDEQADTINRNFDQQQADNHDTTGRLMQRNSDVAAANQGDIWNTYSGARDNSKKFFDSEKEAAGKAFGESRDLLAGQMDFNNATAARSFSPAMAATQRRLRASGVDPNSPEGIAQLQKIDIARAHSFDDNFGENIDKQNKLTMDEYGENNRLGSAALSNDNGLAIEETDKVGKNRSDAMDRNNSYDARQNDITSRNLSDQYGRTANYIDNRRNDIMARDTLQKSEGSRNADLSREGMAVDTQNYNDKVGARGRDLGIQQYGQEGLNGQMNSAYSNANTVNNSGNASANAAYQGNANTYQLEQANAGWGTKLLGGIAGAAMNAFLPGSGKLASFAKGAGSRIF